MNFMVREIVPDDLRQVLRKGEELARHENRVYSDLNYSSHFGWELHHPDYVGYVAVDYDDYILGMISGMVDGCEGDAVPYVYVSNLYVNERCRREGVGTALLQEVLDWTRERHEGINHVRTDVMQELGCHAHAFFTGHGFELIGFDPAAYVDVDGKVQPGYEYWMDLAG